MGDKEKVDWLKMRWLLWDRCGGRCEVSGLPLDFHSFDVHHRRLKGLGGSSLWDTDLPSNLLALRPEVHNGGPLSVHGVRRGWMLDRGFLVRRGLVAGVCPVLVFGERWVRLDLVGGYVLCDWFLPGLG